MQIVVIPELQRKFELIRCHLKRSWTDLETAFGTPSKTLKFWAHGSKARRADRLPDVKLPILTGLIGEMLPGERSADEVRQFVFGPASVLEEELRTGEEELRTGAASSMMALIAREGVETSIRLIPKPDGIELIEVERTDSTPRQRISLGAWFRIVVKRRRRDGHALALQHAQGSWVVVQSAVSPQEPGVVSIPGLDEDDDPLFMHERRDLGRHLFVCLETRDPPPAHVVAHGRDEAILDKRALDAIAAFFEKQPEDRRTCHVLHVEFVAADLA